jgi:hypothetical protein
MTMTVIMMTMMVMMMVMMMMNDKGTSDSFKNA